MEKPQGRAGFLDRMQSAADRLTMGLNVLGTLLIVGLVALINTDVAGRGLFGAPVSGVPELVSMSIVAIVFLQVAQTFRRGRLTRTDALLNVFQRRVPRLRPALEFLYAAIALFIIGALIASSYELFLKAWRRDTFVGTVGDFIAPIWPVKLVILIGCAALMLQLALFALASLKAVFRGGEEM